MTPLVILTTEHVCYLLASIVIVGCGGPLTDPTGTITSPGHPNIYPHGVNCTWNIRVDPGLVVRLTFHTFSIESHSNCMYDSVNVYDSSSADSSSLVGT